MPASYGLFTLPRKLQLLYIFQARATNQYGVGDWTTSLSLAGKTQDQPPFPEDLAIVSGSVGQRSFSITWAMPPAAFALNGSAAIVLYRLRISCIAGLPCPSNCLSLVCPSLDITPQEARCAGAADNNGAGGLCQAALSSDVLTPNTNYSLTLVAQNTLLSPASQPARVTTGRGTPDAPAAPYEVSGYTNTSFAVSFGPAEPNGDALQHYDLDVQCTGGLSRSLTISPPATSTNITGLLPGVNCSIAVTAFNGLGPSPLATFPGFYYTQDRPRAGIAPRPVAQKLSGLPTTEVLHIEWPEPFDFGVPISSYTLVVDGEPQQVSPAAPTAAATAWNEYFLVGLEPGTAHTFSVSATNAIGTGAPSSLTTVTTDSDVPATPDKPTVDTDCRVGGGNCILVLLQQPRYAGVPDASTLLYDLEVYEGNIGPDAQPAIVVANQTAVELMQHCQDAGVTEFGKMCVSFDRSSALNYNMRARVVNSEGPSGWSESVLVGNDRSLYPPYPANVTASPLPGTGKSLQIRWLIVDNARSANLTFEVSASFAANGLSPINQSTAALSSWCGMPSVVTVGGPAFYSCQVRLDGLVPDRHTYVRVIARNAAGSQFSDADALTARDAPNEPAGFRVTAASDSTLTLAWGVPDDNGYPLNGYVLMLQSDDPKGPDQLWLLTPSLEATSPADGRRALASRPGGSATTAAGSASGADAAAACTALDPGPGGPRPAVPSAGTAMDFVLEDLPAGTSLISRLYACNELKASPAACICSRGACALSPGCNSSLAIPLHTEGKPDIPAPISLDQSPSLDVERITSLFMRWTLPYDNELPITATQLCIDSESKCSPQSVVTLPPSLTSYNVSGRKPATQYAAQLRTRNAKGWSAWSPIAWLSTLPTIPDASPAPYCDGSRTSDTGATLSTTHEQLLVQLHAPPSENGQPVLCYEVSIVPAEADAPDYAALDADCSVARCSAAGGNTSTAAAYGFFYSGIESTATEQYFALTNTTAGLTGPLLPHTRFNVSARAINSIGCSARSAISSTCATLPVPVLPPPPLNIVVVVAPLGGFIFLLIVAFCWYCKAQVTKIVAPKLVNRRRKDVLSEFVSSDNTASEEHDPELVINPIMVHKMKANTERQRKAKLKKIQGGGFGGGKSGGLARLGLDLGDRTVKVDPKKLEISQVDMYLEKDRGIVDSSKTKTADQREVAAKALSKGQKKAQSRSHLSLEKNKNDERARHRQEARNATRGNLLHHMPLQEEGEEDGGGPSRQVRQGQGKKHSEVL